MSEPRQPTPPPAGDADEQLRLLSNRLIVATRAGAIGIWDYDLTTNALLWDEQMYRLYGVSVDHFSGAYEAWEAGLHPDDLAAEREKLQKAIRGEQDFDTEFRVIWPEDGSVHFIKANATVVRDASGAAVRVIGTNQDITEQRRVEEDLRVTTNRLLLATKAGAIGIWDLDITTGALVWDEQMYRLYGIAPDHFSGAYEAWEAGLHPDDVVGEREKLQMAIRGEQEFDTEFRVIWPEDGSVHFIKANATVLRDANGQAFRMIGTNWDTTEQRQVEEALRIAKRHAEEAARAKSEFLANMSHEIRTPMNGIMGLTELLLRADVKAEHRHHLKLISQSANALLAIINDILDVSRIEAGKLHLDALGFDLRDSVGDTLQTMGLRAAEKGVELAYRVASDVPQRVVGDAGRIRQVLVNLVGNALKFTAAGEVVVDVQVESRTGNKAALRFRVEDTGIGIAADKQSRIFESFTQAESSTSRSYGGTGLGLTICQELVTMMNGRIWVESQPGRGSTFTFVVELEVEDTGDAAARKELNALRGMRVLVVEDSVTSRSILADLLTGWAMEARCAGSGGEALQILTAARDSARPFQLVLIDALMPPTDGMEVAARIRDELGADAPRILLLSLAGQPVSSGRVGEIVDGVLTKPVKQLELIEAITGVVDAAPSAGAVAPGLPFARPATVPAMRVLLAEDGEVNRVLAVTLLEGRGHSVVVAEDGRVAVELHARETFDAVLMDVQMPQLDGYAATALIRKREQATGQHIPIIAMTANAMQGDRERCLAAGMDAYVAKPVAAQELFEILERYAERPDA